MFRSILGSKALIAAFHRAGGATYCCVASFALAGRVSHIPNPRALRRWLVSRQVRPPVRPPPSEDSDDEDDDEGDGADAEEKEMAGFQGRIGKDTDACYSFWCQGALKVGPAGKGNRQVCRDVG